jgi:hypothetical protein
MLNKNRQREHDESVKIKIREKRRDAMIMLIWNNKINLRKVNRIEFIIK